jgi:hypothetical protein
VLADGHLNIQQNSQRPRPSGRVLKKGNNSLAASIPTLPGGALKGGGKMNTIKITVTVQPPFGAELLRIIKATFR